MDSQDHRKNHPQGGHDSHGVHVCHKCGWPFPNPHPSAKHRRAHKKICGTIEGYKLVHSDEGSSHLTISDDEHQSDEDQKTPSPRILERSSNERGSGAIGDRSGRSEDEVFSDAVTEFADSGSGKGIEETLDDVKKQETLVADAADSDTITSLSFDDAAITGVVPPPRNSADISCMQNTEVHGSNLYGSIKDSQNYVASTNIEERSLSSYRTEESVCAATDDKGGSTFDSKPVQHETQTKELQKNYEETVGEDMAEADARGIEETQNKENNSNDRLIETNARAIGKIHFGRDVKVSSSDNAGEASGMVSKFGEPENITSDPASDAGDIQMKEQFNDKLDPKISLHDLSSEVLSAQQITSSIHTSQVKADAIPVASGESGNLVESSNGEERGSNNVHVLSVPGDIPVVENAEAMIIGFKDTKGGRLPHLVDVDSLELTSDAKESVSKDYDSTVCSTQSKGTEVSVSELILENNFERRGDNNELIVEKFPDEIAQIMPQDKVSFNESQRTEEFVARTYASGIEVEKSFTVQRPEESVGERSSEGSALGHATEVLIDSNPVAGAMDVKVGQIIEVVGIEDAGYDEQSRGPAVLTDMPVAATTDTEVRQITNVIGMEDADGDEKSRVTKVLTDINPAASTTDIEFRQLTNLLDPKDPSGDEKSRVDSSDIVKNEGDIIKEESCKENVITTLEEGKVKSYNEPETRTGEGDSTLGSVEANNLMKTAIPKYANDLQGNCVTSENVINAPEKNLLEPECLQLSRSSDDQEGVKVLESNGNGKVQVEGTSSISAAAESGNIGANYELQKPSDNARDAELLQKSSEEHLIKETEHSLVDNSASIQNHATVGDNRVRDFVGFASEDKSEPLPDGGENKCGAQQLGLSATDLSVDSGSQTDSLEGHWGSVSVLSTQSDLPAFVDAETLAPNGSKASLEAEKTDSKKPKAFPEGQQQSDKSDIFEPPSFMTLVEPRGGDNVAASEIQTAQNTQQPKAASPQAGWFPSLTNVVNESEGRKKNEEIIAKVTNWSAGKQHTPLKNLLGEANAETKSKLPNTKENTAPVVQKDETNKKDDGSSPTAVNPMPNAQVPVIKPVKKDAGKEWNSPARYPADIKREKRKVKGRPYWAQFMCCSSVN